MTPPIILRCRGNVRKDRGIEWGGNETHNDGGRNYITGFGGSCDQN
jgi:hypothetical protein